MKTHTMNPALTITAGKNARELSESIKDLTDIKTINNKILYLKDYPFIKFTLAFIIGILAAGLFQFDLHFYPIIVFIYRISFITLNKTFSISFLQNYFLRFIIISDFHFWFLHSKTWRNKNRIAA
ncbi:MAG: hypothetical protein MZV64_08085 [Ignavibacteriales bacterium]|nr:hypothetical protein [Ignavibacteriales bacterium]